VDLFAVMTEVAAQIDTITGLRAYAWHQGTVAAPAALVGWPDRADYAQTYQRYQTRVPDLPVLVVVGKASERVAAKRLGEFVAETGAKSIPAKIMARAGSWVACDLVTVSWVGFPAVTLAGVDYLAAEFHLDVTGRGAQ
jgi:hypothetical protein